MATSPLRRREYLVQAFTLVELLVVIGIIVVLMSLMGPALNSLTRASDVTKASYDVAGILEVARAYAIANNTYVFVGFEELDASKDQSTSPQVPAADKIGGRIAVAVVASKDGTPCANPFNLSSTWKANYHNGANLTAVGKVQVFENMHIAESLGTIPPAGAMVRPAVQNVNQVGDTKFRQINPFSWPLGTALGQGKFNFTKVLCFDPRGFAYNSWQANKPATASYFEIGLQQTHGNVPPPTPANASVGNQVAIMVNGITGRNRIYRP